MLLAYRETRSFFAVGQGLACIIRPSNAASSEHQSPEQTLTESSALDHGLTFASWVMRAGAWFAAVLIAVTDVSADQGVGEVKTQGGWVYTTRDSEGGTEYMATVQAEEGSTWLLLACRPDKRVSLPNKDVLAGRTALK
jgi:hypothetical protein